MVDGLTASSNAASGFTYEVTPHTHSGSLCVIGEAFLLLVAPCVDCGEHFASFPAGGLTTAKQMSNMPKSWTSRHYETQWKRSSIGASLSSNCYIKADEMRGHYIRYAG